MLEGWVSVVINTLLFVVKLILGLMSGSIALIADAVHTISDSLTSVVVIVSAYTARRPADEEHPFGHGRAESIATVLVAVLLGVAGIEFGKSSVERLIHPETIEAPWWVVAVIAATMLTKEWLARFALDLARSSGNKTLEADAWHHRSDVLATALVVVAMVAGRYGLTLVDGIMGILISVVLFKVAYEIAKGAIDTLLGPAPTKEQIRAIAESAESVQGVRGVHDIVIHSYGPTHFYSLHIEVDANLPATELHALAEQVEHRVNNGEHGSVCVHIDPIDIDHPFYASTHALVEELVKNDEHVRTFHDLRIFGSAESYTVACDVTIDPSCHEADGAIRQRLERAILDRCDAKRVIIEIDPRYSYPGVTEA
jgi:cation diffusion facilitator family transporter